MQFLTEKLKGVRSRGWNSEHPLVFESFILPMEENMRYSKDIKGCIERHMKIWDHIYFVELV